MNKLSIQKHKLPFGDYVACELCGKEWSIYVGLNLNDEHEIVICPDCFEDFKARVNKI